MGRILLVGLFRTRVLVLSWMAHLSISSVPLLVHCRVMTSTHLAVTCLESQLVTMVTVPSYNLTRDHRCLLDVTPMKSVGTSVCIHNFLLVIIS